MKVTRAGIDKTLSVITRFLVSCMVALMFFSYLAIEANKKPAAEITRILEEQKKMRLILAKKSSGNENLPKVWPPKMNKIYPNLELYDQMGKKFTLSSLSGKVIIMEYIDISSPESQAQSGSAKMGAYYGSKTKEINTQVEIFGDVIERSTNGAFRLPNDNVLELKIIIYGPEGSAGSRDDAQNWAEHFNLQQSDNVIVAVPSNDLRSKATQSIVSGFQLIDKNMMLRVDSSGAEPKHNLGMTLAPLVPKLIR